MELCELFDQINPNDLEKMIECLGGKTVRYQKNEVIQLSGEKIDYVGIILSGRVQIIKEDIYGNRTIISELSTGDVFGEAFACSGETMSSETIQAITDSEIMKIRFEKIVSTCSHACEFHSRLISNMLKIIAKKNLNLNNKMEIVSKRTTRDKIMAYLMTEAEKAEKMEFEIPFSRSELADYLCVERSAMSRELSNMKKDGLIEYQKNNFVLLEQ